MKLRDRSSFVVPFLTALLLVACPTHANELQTDHAGHTLGQWMRDYWQWWISGTGTGRSGDVVFLPIPSGTDPDGDMVFTGSISTSMTSTDVFALPLFVWVGETYGGAMPDDDPALPPRADFVATHVVLTLDGTTILGSQRRGRRRLRQHLEHHGSSEPPP